MTRHASWLPMSLIAWMSGCALIQQPPSPPIVVATTPVEPSARPVTNPIIQSFTANPSNVVAQGKNASFIVAAYDPSDELLQFTWGATGGTLSTNTGEIVSWLPPTKPGVYAVTVTVTTRRGGMTSAIQNLTVLEDGTTDIGPMSVATPAPIAPSPAP